VVADIAAWLHDLGLECYEQAFRDNAIDAEVLPALTDADLEKLAVLSCPFVKRRARLDGPGPGTAGERF
jgi:hypothetical protein